MTLKRLTYVLLANHHSSNTIFQEYLCLKKSFSEMTNDDKFIDENICPLLIAGASSSLA